MKFSRSQRRNRRAFTLLEVMLVLIILVVIAGFAIRNFSGVLEQANKRAATAQIAQLSSAVKQYQLLMQQLPQSLDALMTAPADLANPGIGPSSLIRSLPTLGIDLTSTNSTVRLLK